MEGHTEGNEVTPGSDRELHRPSTAEVPFALFAIDSEGFLTMLETSGIEPRRFEPGKELTRHSVLEVYGDVPRVLEATRHVLSGEALHTEIEIDGSIFEVRCVPLCGENGEVTGAAGFVLDVTRGRRAEEALRENRELVHKLLRNFPNGTVNVFDEDLRYVLAEGKGLEQIGMTPEQMVGKTLDELFAKESVDAVRPYYLRAFAGETVGFDLPLSEHHYYINAAPLRNERGEIHRIIAVAQNVTQLKRTEEALRQAEEKYRSIFENAVEGIFQSSLPGRILAANPAAARILGYDSPEELISRVSDIARQVYYDPRDRARLTALVRERETVTGFEVRMRRKDGSVVWTSLNLRAVRDASGEVRRYEGMIQDVTERRTLQERLSYQASHDPLTDLPNRASFVERLSEALSRVKRSGGRVALLFMDLDNFKVVNDSLGHTAGDELLAHAARRLENCLRPGETVARFGGDEFTILLESVANEGDATAVAERILEALGEPFALGRREVHLTTSIGIALSTADLCEPGELLRCADMAMYRAKELDELNYAMFDSAMSARAVERLNLEADLRRAIARGEFVVHYQPKVELATGMVVGTEALVRWEHPERGLVLPSAFIPLAEEASLLSRIDQGVLRAACQQAAEWQRSAPSRIPPIMCVNVSARRLRYSGFVDDVRQAVEETGLDPEALVLEITEGAVMEDPEASKETLRDLKGLGLRLSVDDFGTGYSSLAYLGTLPLDMLKVDYSFIRKLPEDSGNEAIVRAMCNLAHDLGLRVVAEGIETEEQLRWLQDSGCEFGQGDYLAKPLLSLEAGELLSKGYLWEP